MLLSDHYLTLESFGAASEAIRTGGDPQFPPDLLASIQAELKANPISPHGPIGCRIAVWFLIGTMIALAGALIVALIAALR